MQEIAAISQTLREHCTVFRMISSIMFPPLKCGTFYYPQVDAAPQFIPHVIIGGGVPKATSSFKSMKMNVSGIVNSFFNHVLLP
jgi:hypothetical protein